MDESGQKKQLASWADWYRRLSTSKKVILIVFIIWFIQAVPKWSLAIIADGETSAKIMRIFETPR